MGCEVVCWAEPTAVVIGLWFVKERELSGEILPSDKRWATPNSSAYPVVVQKSAKDSHQVGGTKNLRFLWDIVFLSVRRLSNDSPRFSFSVNFPNHCGRGMFVPFTGNSFHFSPYWGFSFQIATLCAWDLANPFEFALEMLDWYDASLE